MLPFFIFLSAFVGQARTATPSSKTTTVVLFGDSFTDQSRAHSIANGTYPGKDYQEVFPPADTAADGGVQWPWYLGLYGNYKIWNYATGGAVCSNALTPLFGEPDVVSGQMDWFVQDHIENKRLGLNPEEFVVVLYIGTNDIGIHSFATDDQSPTVSLADLANCQLQTLRNLFKLGARRFIVNSLIPLELTRLYSPSSAPTIYYPAPHNGTQWNARIYNFVQTMNALLKGGVLALRQEWAARGASVQMFDTYGLFTEMYHNPTRFFNGSAPANVTGHCHQCPDADDYRQCGMPGPISLATAETVLPISETHSCGGANELHPSEQTGRNLAMEMFRAISGHSKFLS
ncbi:hypothetical protein MIND_00956600 [Mycena indigotica]|uniref:Uncharacterized protein n=1 Tax=Mycena indigotica TaxID=2126181 RepID=A0A8H6SG55_9AGAR|nr:uncharacterized protein MIND_00956600 [Mycena indigotica]KAF7297235.1 hypothetical protein MIND_00956600 [Mycena indigotica]